MKFCEVATTCARLRRTSDHGDQRNQGRWRAVAPSQGPRGDLWSRIRFRTAVIALSSLVSLLLKSFEPTV